MHKILRIIVVLLRGTTFSLALFFMVSYSDTMKLRSTHLRTLHSIFEVPVRSGIPWMDIEKLLIALGAQISKGKGSRVRIYLNEVKAVFHRPHPRKETDKGAVKSMRRFLLEAGYQPEE